jgi:hypothetical protein
MDNYCKYKYKDDTSCREAIAGQTNYCDTHFKEAKNRKRLLKIGVCIILLGLIVITYGYITNTEPTKYVTERYTYYKIRHGSAVPGSFHQGDETRKVVSKYLDNALAISAIIIIVGIFCIWGSFARVNRPVRKEKR